MANEMNVRKWIRRNPYFFKNLDTENFYFIESVAREDCYIIRKASLEECKMVNSGNKAIFEFEYFLRKTKEIDLNFRDFQRSYNQYKDNISSIENPEAITPQLTREIFIDINRTFTNYINSCRMFIDHMDARIKHKYGGAADKYETFHKAKSYCYDTYFSYRLIYFLRNFAEHDDFPIYNINFYSDWKQLSNTSGYVSNMDIYFDKQRLLSSRLIKSIIKEDLKQRNNLFPVMPIITDYSVPLKYIFDTLLRIEKDYYIENANVIMKFQNMNQHGGKIEVGRFSKDEDGSIGYTPTKLYTDIIEELRTSLSRLV